MSFVDDGELERLFDEIILEQPEPGYTPTNHDLLSESQVPLFPVIGSSTERSQDPPVLATEEGGDGVLRQEGGSSQDPNLGNPSQCESNRFRNQTTSLGLE